jgi:hypothetical protein
MRLNLHLIASWNPVQWRSTASERYEVNSICGFNISPRLDGVPDAPSDYRFLRTAARLEV